MANRWNFHILLEDLVFGAAAGLKSMKQHNMMQSHTVVCCVQHLSDSPKCIQVCMVMPLRLQVNSVCLSALAPKASRCALHIHLHRKSKCSPTHTAGRRYSACSLELIVRLHSHTHCAHCLVLCPGQSFSPKLCGVTGPSLPRTSVWCT